MTAASRLLCSLLPACLLAATPAIAQDEPDQRGRFGNVTVGGGVVFIPAFPGARDLKLRPWPMFDIRPADEERGFSTPDQSAGIGLFGNDDFRVGPAINISSGRDEDDAIPGIGDVGTTIEGGAFAEAYLSDALRLRAEVRKGFGGHKGLIADLGADFISGRPSDPFHFSIGPRLRLANDRYVRAFYGINPEQSELTGLPVYDAGGGLHSAGGLAFAELKITDSIGAQAYGRYDRLIGDAKDSPLVLSSVGSRDQYEFGIGLTYSFDVR